MTRMLFAAGLVFALGCAGLRKPPTPYQGTAARTLELEGSGPTAEADAPLLRARFEAVGVSAKVEATGANTLRVELDGLSPDAELTTFFARNVTTFTFGDEVLLTNAHVQAAHVERDAFNQLVVHAQLTPEGTDRFCEGSRAAIGKPIVIATDGVELSSPIVQDPICGGKVQITGNLSGREPWALAAALERQALDSNWQLTTVE